MRGVYVRYAGVAGSFEAGVPGRKPQRRTRWRCRFVGYQGCMSGRMSTHTFEARLTIKM